MGRWTTLTNPNAEGGPTYNFGPGFDVNGTTVTWALTDPTNSLFDPGFENNPPLGNWTQSVPGAFTVDATIFFQGLRSAKTSTPGSYLAQIRFCDPFDQFVAAVYSRTSAGATGTCTLTVFYYDNTGALIAYNPYVQGTPGTSWGILLLPDTVVPSNAAKMQIVLRMDAGATGTWYFDNASLRRLQKGNNIQAGAVSTNHLAAGSLGDLSKYSSTIRAVAVVTALPTLPSANYPQGAIIFNLLDGKLYRADTATSWSKSHDPQDLIAGTLAAGVVYAGTINCEQINAGTLNSNVVYSGQINADQVNAGDFTGFTLELTRNGITTSINNTVGSAGSAAGLTVAASGGDTTYIMSSGLAILYGNSAIAAIADSGSGNGIVLLYDNNTGPQVDLEARATGGFLALGGTAPYIKMGAVPVLGPRKTGWTAATGTATRTSFATSSVTLPNLAQAVKALIDDLMSHGAIGA